ncbi:methyltransferase family protein,acyltransferase family protein,phosphopantetheine-containing protein [Mycolicibacterium rhodesiae NBB3]|uniref:Methyltransferase family protein,acyltransferase family protein,phosphopantetheine-containing protein n=1 Tax=Mycolicibacterium rhodesiae (strain NBB3) TaxID=710685 RepID=G8RKP4_MYCRN|nr:nocobactin polyketide synthase NbtC [Mycolicibacterium rhodesiae]AEV74835.1 methyltransferase family protein,acyltransferase family protein,phosphopantetheine-containing protein [Mycolicibacterium rhodesiae NBB3]
MRTPSSACRSERNTTISEYRLPDGTIPVLLSADTPSLLRSEAAALLDYLRNHPTVPPERLADMLFRTRAARRYRVLSMVAERAVLEESLRCVVDGGEHSALVRGDNSAAAHRLAFVLPGQGGQRPGMGSVFYESSPAFRAEIDRCHNLFGELFGESPLGYLLGSVVGDATTVVQSALFMQMVALGAMWRSVGVDAAAVIGHSQGEIAGAYLAGKMTLEDAVLIVGTRARAAENISSDDYAMAVVAADRDECESVLARQCGWAQVSVINSPRLVGISGDRDTVAATVDALAANGRFTRVIPVRYPAHTSIVNQFRDEIEAAVRDRVRNQRFLDSDIDFIGSTLGESVTPAIGLAEYWFWNLRNTVRFDRAVAAAVADQADTFVELAEHPTLQYALQENLDVLAAQSATVVGTSDKNASDLSVFTRNLGVIAVNDIGYRWDALRTENDGPVTLPLLDFPNTQFNESSLWLPYEGCTAPLAPAHAAELERDAPRPQVIVEEWTALTRRSMAPPRRLGIIDLTGGDLAPALCAHAETQELSARLIAEHAAADDIESLVVLLPALGAMSQADAAQHVTRFFTDRTWWFESPVKDYWLITVGGEAVVAADGPPHPVPAAISAGFRCLGGEYPDTAFRHLDLSSDIARPESAAAIIAALHTADEPELALRRDGLYAKRLIDTDPNAAASPLTDRHVLITGGTGNVGMEFCEHAASGGARRITLVNRSGETADIARRLRAVKTRGAADIGVIACDIADPTAVRRLADDIGDDHVDLVIHAALDGGSAADMRLADLTEAKFDAALRGKVVGISHVLDTVTLAADARVLMCSSTAAVLGGRGKIMYAAANRMLDAHAAGLRTDGRDCVSVQWGQWAVYQGQDSANLAEVGYLPMRSQDAIALGLGGLPGNAAVAAFDWDRARAVLSALGYGPTLSQLKSTREEASAVPAESADEVDVPRRMLQLLAEALGADDPQALDSTVPLVALGLDSLTALTLRRRIKTEFSCEVVVSELLGGATLDDVVHTVNAEAGGPSQHRANDLDMSRIPSARSDLDLFGLHAIWRVLEPVLGDGATHTADEIADRLQFVERHRWVLRQWLHELTTRGFLHRDSGYRRAADVPSPIRSGLVDVCSDLGYLPLFGKFLDDCNRHLADLVADRISVQELLFPNGSTATADAFYRDNAISRYLNLGARTAVADAVRRIAADRSPVRILELGAGVGGMTNDVVAGLDGLPVDYHFTDVSTFFLNAAQRRFADKPWMRFGMVDLNADLRRQPPCDIVVASNVVHNALDVGRTLGEIHDLLRPGGAVIFIEVCQAHCSFMTSVYFLMSPPPGRSQVGLTDVRAGTDRIFLTQDEWHDQLAANGLTPAKTLPTADHPLSRLDQYVFVAERG